MVEKTKTINKITLDDKQWEYAHRMQIMMNFDKVVKEFVAKFNDIIADDDDIPFWRKIKNKNLYYIHTLKLIVGDIKHLPKKNSKINDYIPNFLQANITEDDAKKRDSLLLTLGNLAIIPQALNASIRDAAWNVKKAGKGQNKPGLLLCASGLYTLHDVLQKNDWNEHEIENRAEWLLANAQNIWKI